MVSCNAEDRRFPLLYLFLGMLRKPSMGRSQKTYEKETSSGRRNMEPSQMFHGRVPTFRADADVKVPDSVQKLCHGHSCETRLKTLAVLKLKYNLEILMLHPVVQESIITYPLKTGR